VTEGVGCLACGSSNVEAGVKLRPKDLRDYFASSVKTDDPRVLMALMRHTNLTTTTKYIQAVRERMKDAVSGFGVENSTAKNLDTALDTTQNGLGRYKTAKNSISAIPTKLVSYELSEGKNDETH
jgi:hypothetical protein